MQQGSNEQTCAGGKGRTRLARAVVVSCLEVALRFRGRVQAQALVQRGGAQFPGRRVGRAVQLRQQHREQLGSNTRDLRTHSF